MKTTPYIPEEDSKLDALLRQYILIDNNDKNPININAMNISAEIVFGSPAFEIPSAKREKEMLATLYKNLYPGSSRRWGLWVLLFVFVLSIPGYYYLNPKRRISTSIDMIKTPVQAFNRDQNIGKAIERPSKTTASDNKHESLSPDNKTNTIPASTTADTTRHDTTTVKDDKGADKKDKKFRTDYKTPQPRLWAEDKQKPWEEYNALWQPTPKNYVKSKASFTIDTIGGPQIEVLNHNINHDYYTGKPFKKDPEGLFYINYAEILQKAQNSERLMKVPVAGRFYVDSQSTTIHHNSIYYTVPNIPQKLADQILQPFYFRKYEVSNLEYREFLKWVARRNGFDNFNTAHQSDADIAKAFVYTFQNTTIPGLKDLPSASINVFPDTLAFNKDLLFKEADAMTKVYFTHPAYNDYPVCGINYWQAMAYLDWMTKNYQDYFDNHNMPYRISFALPTDVEWEMAACIARYSSANTYFYANIPVFDNNWITDLKLSNFKENERFKSLDMMLDNDVISRGNYILDGYFYPGPVDLSLKKYQRFTSSLFRLHLLETGISWMDGNVSEWMQETYKDNWLAMYKKQHQLLEQSNKEEDKILAMVQDYFNKRNDADGHLVRGGNYLDERFSNIDDRNLAGIMLKRFVSPSKSSSMIGFRYVVRVVEK